MRLFWSAIMLGTIMPAYGQPSPSNQPDNAALLKAIERLNGRLDQLQKENERLKAKSSTEAPAAARAPAPGAEVPSKAVPGWFINLIPWSEDRNGDAIGGFPGPVNEFNFDLHSRYFPGQNRYIYRGISLLHVREDGNYTFSVTLEPVASPGLSNMWAQDNFNCSTELLINGNRIAAGSTNFETMQLQNKDIWRSQTFYGQSRLTPEAGKGFRIEFRTDCWWDGNKNTTYFDKLLPGWKKNRFRIMIKTPNDTAPRPFRPDELYYVGKPS